MCIFRVSFSLLEEGTYSAFMLFAKTKYFLDPPQTPFVNKSFPDAWYLQSAPALGNQAPYRPNQKESVPGGAMSRAPPSESPVLRAVQLNSRCALRGMLGRRKCSSCPPGVRGPAGQMLVRGQLAGLLQEWTGRSRSAGLEGAAALCGGEATPPAAGLSLRPESCHTPPRAGTDSSREGWFLRPLSLYGSIFPLGVNVNLRQGKQGADGRQTTRESQLSSSSSGSQHCSRGSPECWCPVRRRRPPCTPCCFPAPTLTRSHVGSRKLYAVIGVGTPTPATGLPRATLLFGLLAVLESVRDFF